MSWHKAGPHDFPTRYVVSVTDYPPELIAASTEEKRFAMTADMTLFGALFGLKGKLIRDQPITQGALKGREQVIEVEGMGTLRTRAFYRGPRQYVIFLASQPRFLNSRAAEHFLNSFRVEGPPPKKE
jgi:hypothetical protein